MTKQQNIARKTLLLLLLALVNTPAIEPAYAITALTPPRPQKSALNQATATARFKNISGVSYRLQINLAEDSDSYTGQVQINFTIKNREIPLEVDFADGQIEALTINQTQVPKPEYAGHFISIDHKLLRQGKNLIKIKFKHKYSHDGFGLNRFIDPEDRNTYVFSDLEPYYANRLFPCFDQPDLKAKILLTVTAPANWTVVSSVRETAVKAATDAKQRRWEFPWSPPLSTYAFAVIAGPFKIWQDRYKRLPLRLLARASHAAFVDHREWLQTSKKGLGFFEEYFGYTFPFPKYDQIILPNLASGAMENVGAATFSESFVTGNSANYAQRLDRDEVILHELAHMWFGNLVTMRWWDDLWLNESFATYMSFVAMDKALDMPSVWRRFHSGIKTWAYDVDASTKQPHPVRAQVEDTDTALTAFDGIAYGKGAAVLKQLTHYIGQKSFRDGLRDYFRSFAFANATTDDLVNSLSKHSKADIAAYAKAWLEIGGFASVTPDIECNGAKISRLTLNFATANGGEVAERPLIFDVVTFKSTAGGLLIPDQKAIIQTKQKKMIVHALKGRPCPKLVVIDSRDQIYARIGIDQASVDTLKRSLHRVSSPDVRLLLWSRLWFMLLHQEISLREFADIAFANLAKEKQPHVFDFAADLTIGSQNGRVPSLLRFLNETERHELTKKLEKILLQRLRASSDSTEMRTAIFPRYISTVRSSIGQEQLQNLLDGSNNINGVIIDQNQRWQILLQLALLQNESSKNLLAIEERADPSLEGKLWKRRVEAALATDSDKARMLSDLVSTSDKDIAFAERQATLSYIAPLIQDSKLQKTSKEFFALLPKVVAQQDPLIASSFIALAAPTSCDRGFLNQFSKALNQKNLPKLARIELETLDREARRCLKMRSA